MAANDDKLIISKELAEKLKINEESLAQQIGNVVSPVIVKQIEKLSQTLAEKPKEAPLSAPEPFSSSKLLSNLPSFVRGLFPRSPAQSEAEQDIQQEQDVVKSESSSSSKLGLIQKLLSTLTSKPIEQPKPEQKSLLEKEKVTEKPVTVGGFSDSALEKLSAILPEAVTKGTQHIADSLAEVLKKFDKLIDAVKNMSDGDGAGGLLDDVIDFLPGRKGRARRGTLARKAKAKALRAKRAASQKFKTLKAKTGAKVNDALKKTGADKVVDKIKGKPSTALQKAGSVADDVKPSALGKVASVADDVKQTSALGKVASVADDVKPSALGKVASVADDAGAAASKVKPTIPVTAIEKVGGPASKLKTAASGLSKVGGTALKGLGAAGAVLGAGMEFASRKEEGQTNTQATVGTAGTAAGGALGAWGGAAAGAAIGSVVPVVGTVIGGIAGGLIGGFGGAWLGGKGADKLTGVEETVKEKAVIDEWKTNIEAADPVLGKEYVSTYEKLPEDKKKEINTTLVVNWEGDRESAEDTVKKRLQEANPKLVYGDKIPTAMTEVLDKAIQSSQEGKTAPLIPSVPPSVDSVIDQPGKSLNATPLAPTEQPKVPDSIKSVIDQPGKALDAPVSFGLEGIKPVQDEGLEPPEVSADPEYPFSPPIPTPALESGPKAATSNAVKALATGAVATVTPGVAASIGASLAGNKTAPAAGIKSNFGKSVTGSLFTAGLASAIPGGALLAGIGSSLFGKKENKPEELALGQQEAISPPVPKAESDSIASIKPETVSSSIAETAAASAKDAGKGEGLLQTIAENTKKTSEQVSRLADAFTVFSKMLPGSIASMSSKSDSTPVVVSPKQPSQQGDTLKSTQIAKAGNSIIHDFRSALEGARQLPA